MKYRNLVVRVFSFFLMIDVSFASMHFSDCPDEEFLRIADQFLCVGAFSIKGISSGSGILINTNHKDLKGRVVLTAAHVLIDHNNEKDDIRFLIKDAMKTGKNFLNTDYLDFFNKTGLELWTHDLALFFLDTPIEDVPGAEVNWDARFEECFDQVFRTVGNGVTGHVYGEHEIFDGKARGSYSCAMKDNQQLQDGEVTSSFEGKIARWVKKRGSFLNLTVDNMEAPLPCRQRLK